ncbi:aspartyl protease [Aquipseudomonas alcaligenes]|uniref:TIGR02281 family clan AA aspartic protease n=1 Tax=Aquipseudomonas alcaligenes (strain ATCC 14909 / DSM 50342 / CCUG 1425 / JCM 20561 / NBRC 14159 / NCIMB 9945 / NCTC 10367 / 1577) TaxID=1215092 RepID=U2Z5A1_AQUA1|nr:hypothetical protein PA6_017_00370 [Pseudomonas alcaligenes NBRC 14159]SUD19315.1 aspartyl protease [Pseudomonas alcaligenes]
MRRLELFAASVLLALCPVLQAETQVQVVGLFPNAAVLLVDGQRKLVRAGQVGPGGVKVISADSKGAVLEVDGVQRSYAMTREYNQAGSSEPQKAQLSSASAVARAITTGSPAPSRAIRCSSWSTPGPLRWR